MIDQPHFRFYPNAYAEGEAFTASDATCEACQRPAVWLFTGVIYKEADTDPNVCARCIADGRLNQLAPGYTLHDMDFSEAPAPALAQEIEQRTPGFATWNAFVWPVRNAMPLAFMGYGSDAALQTPEVSAAIKAAGEDYEIEDVDPHYALVFRALDGSATIAVLDFD